MGIKYFFLQTKRFARALPFVMLLSLLLVACLLLALSAFVESDSSSDEKLGVGIVGDTENTYLELGLVALRNFDSSRFALDVSFMEEDEAKRALGKGDISAYIVIPENFITNAYHGDVGKLKYVSTTGAVDFSTIIKDEILKMISVILVESQKGIYASGDIALEYAEGLKYGEITNEASFEYIDIILSRSNIYKTYDLGFGDGLDLFTSVFCGGLIFFLLLSCIGFAPVFARREEALSRLLCARGFSPFRQILSEYFSYFLSALLSSGILVAAIFTFAGKELLSLVGMSEADASFFLLLALGYMMISAMNFLIFEATRSIAASVLGVFFCAVVTAYFSGCLYPINFFPELIRELSVFLPAGAFRALISAHLMGESKMLPLAVTALYTLLFFALSVLIRRRRTNALKGDSI